ncbi:MAG: hypothetical protein LBN27_09065 [Prevotellaceae bacterium]|jgi:hypothetical protein|nr:hypothetical protein [Prevotellaceae bacterium]
MVKIKYMVDEQYFEQFINKETGKERYVLIQKEAEKYYQNNSAEECLNIAMEYYNNEHYYIQMWAVYVMGLVSNKYKTVLNFLKNTVSKKPFLASARIFGNGF